MKAGDENRPLRVVPSKHAIDGWLYDVGLCSARSGHPTHWYCVSVMVMMVVVCSARSGHPTHWYCVSVVDIPHIGTVCL